MKLQKFVPLTKMEEQSDGTLHVYGTVTAQEPDLDREVCDYDGTKPFYVKRTEERLAQTSKIEGMTPSIMPMREMHALKGIGAGRSIVFDDVAKTIKMGFHVVDMEAVKKWRAGVFVGFSQGGSYVKQWPDPEHEGCTRYIADPAEVSAVDSPCLPSALVESMKGRTVTLMKASGVTEEVPLAVEPQMFDTLLQVATHVKALLACGDLPKDARSKVIEAAQKSGITISERDERAIKRACAKIALEKGLYEVGWLGDLIEQLHWLCLQTEFERDMEDDGSKVPDGLRAAWLKLIAEFKAMAVEEADEIAAAGGEKGEKGMKITDQEGLTKAAKSIHEHLAKMEEVHKAHGEHMKKAHEGIEAKHEQLGEHIEKCMKAAKDTMEGEEPEKAAPTGEVTKATDDRFAALEAQLGGLVKANEELTALLKSTPATVPAHTGAGALEKAISAPQELAALIQ